MLLGQCRSEIKMWLCLIGLRLQLCPLLVDQLVEVTSENIVLSYICCGLLAGTLFVYFFRWNIRWDSIVSVEMFYLSIDWTVVCLDPLVNKPSSQLSGANRSPQTRTLFTFATAGKVVGVRTLKISANVYRRRRKLSSK